jgi:hypothetical protein
MPANYGAIDTCGMLIFILMVSFFGQSLKWSAHVTVMLSWEMEKGVGGRGERAASTCMFTEQVVN